MITLQTIAEEKLNYLLHLIEEMDFDKALDVIERNDYDREEIESKKRYWSKLSMPFELKDFFEKGVERDPGGYACASQLYYAITGRNFTFALYLINNHKYSRWTIDSLSRRTDWKVEGLPKEIENWIYEQKDMCHDSR